MPLTCAFAEYPPMIEMPALTTQMTALMRDLAVERPVFHSEADFQHALAWRIREKGLDSNVRLEYKPPINIGKKEMQLDIWLAKLGVAIELKYKTGKPKEEIRHNGELFTLRNHSACDIGRYDFLKDIQRLESLSQFPDAKVGVAILLTNDHLYWNGPTRKDTVDADFSLRGDPGLLIQGEMAWSERASAGTKRGRVDSIRLMGAYKAQWRAYSRITDESYGEFRYLMISAAIP